MNKKLEVLILKPGSQKKIYGELSTYTLTAIEPPFWASLLAGHLRNLGYTVELRDAEVEEWSYAETAEKIKELNPLLTVISVSGTNPSASTMNMTGTGQVLKHLKEIAPDIKTLYHGLHPSSLPRRTLMEETVDFVCQGEGFYTLPKLIEALKAGETGLDKVEGLWYKLHGEAHVNLPAPLLRNLDELPMPAWDLLPMQKYRAHNWHCFDNLAERQPYGVIYTSLGCPYSCTFCCINAIFGKPGIRYRSAKNVIDEIDFLVTHYGIRNIKIIDELFAIKESRVVEICDMLIERRYDLNMWAYARVNSVTPKMLEKMKQAGIHWVAYGFEAGTKSVLKGVNKEYDIDLLEKVVKLTYEAGLYIVANFIFGLPDDDFDTMQDTLALALEINAEWGNFYAAMAYPGSKLYEEAVSKGWPLPDTWQGYSPYSYECLPLPTNSLNHGEVLSFRDYAFHAYFENPRYLDKVKKTFGMEVVRHVQEMTKYRLRRKHTQWD